jgi:hypothetical protein
MSEEQSQAPQAPRRRPLVPISEIAPKPTSVQPIPTPIHADPTQPGAGVPGSRPGRPTPTVSAAADPVFANVLKLAQKQSGKATHFTIRGGRVLYYGLPSPSVAQSYGLGSNVIPFGRAVHLVGEKGSFKSACAFDIIRMMLELAETGLLREPSVPLIAGTHRYVENESKPAYDFLLSFLEHRPQYADVLRGHETRFLEEWTEALNDAVGSTWAASWAKNIAKLKVRFPDKFTQARAIDRDLDAERAALETP